MPRRSPTAPREARCSPLRAPASSAGTVSDTALPLRLRRARRHSALVSRYRDTTDPFATSERDWATSLPKATFGSSYRWLNREFLWDAYLLRSATVDEELCGEHTVTQGGYYQTRRGRIGGHGAGSSTRFPHIHGSRPGASDIALSGTFPTESTLQFPYGSTSLCQAYNLGESDDFDFWFMWAAANYALVTRDLSFFDQSVHFYDSTTSVSLWQHIKLSFEHMQSLLGPHGEYLALSLGDWSDLLPAYSGMTESDLVVAQCAFMYPELAEAADMFGDHGFAVQLRAAASRDLSTLQDQWTGKGWYARGYAESQELGSGVKWLEPQPWAILAGAPNPRQAATLVANIRRYLDGIDVPRRPRA